MRLAKTILSGVLIAMMLAPCSQAADVDENPPDGRRAVEEILEGIGGEHNPEDMKVAEVGSVETETTFYHIYRGYRRDAETYRIIIFDNTPKYIGYYELPYEPTDVEEGAIVLTVEDATKVRQLIPIPDKGPAKAVRLEGVAVTAKFVKAPAPEKDETETEAAEGSTALPSSEDVAAEPGAEPEKPAPKEQKVEYREWTITQKGKTFKTKAKFVRVESNGIILKSAKNGEFSRPIPVTSLSKQDREYLRDL